MVVRDSLADGKHPALLELIVQGLALEIMSGHSVIMITEP